MVSAAQMVSCVVQQLCSWVGGCELKGSFHSWGEMRERPQPPAFDPAAAQPHCQLTHQTIQMQPHCLWHFKNGNAISRTSKLADRQSSPARLLDFALYAKSSMNLLKSQQELFQKKNIHSLQVHWTDHIHPPLPQVLKFPETNRSRPETEQSKPPFALNLTQCRRRRTPTKKGDGESSEYVYVYPTCPPPPPPLPQSMQN